LHGIYLCINHAWSNFGPAVGQRFARVTEFGALILTFLSVVVAWVFFRADSMSSAARIVSRMADPTNLVFGFREEFAAGLVCVYVLLMWFAPNTQEITGYDHKHRVVGRDSDEAFVGWPLMLMSAMTMAFGILGIQQHSEFIYFRF
jgi:hypothetical protein